MAGYYCYRATGVNTTGIWRGEIGAGADFRPGWSRLVPVGPGWSRLVPVGPGWSRLVPASANTLMSLHPGSISGCFAGAREFHDLAVAGGPEKGYSADAIRCLQQRIADSDALETYWQSNLVRPIRTTSAAKILND